MDKMLNVIKNNIVVITILVVSLIVGASIVGSQYMKSKSIEKQLLIKVNEERLIREEQKEKEEKERVEKDRKRLFLDLCISEADESYWNYMRLNGTVNDDGSILAMQRYWDFAQKDKNNDIDECYRKYNLK